MKVNKETRNIIIISIIGIVFLSSIFCYFYFSNPEIIATGKIIILDYPHINKNISDDFQYCFAFKVEENNDIFYLSYDNYTLINTNDEIYKNKFNKCIIEERIVLIRGEVKEVNLFDEDEKIRILKILEIDLKSCKE